MALQRHDHMIRLLFLIFLVGIVCIFCTCNKKEQCLTCPPHTTGTVELSLNYTECTEVWLKLKFTDNNQPRGYTVLKDGKQLLSGTLLSVDTVLIDTSVVAGHDYTYVAQRLNNSTLCDSSTPLSVHTLDSISHAIQWVIDTLGAQGLIRDVWVFDRNNAWAVGEIYLKDSTGQINMSNPYNAAYWDGSKWTLRKIGFYTFCGQQYQNAYPASSIFAFSLTDIWIAMNGSEIARWNGISQTETMCTPISISKLWGTSSNDIYAVGALGGIAHYNGSTWTKLTSGTTVDLQDIYGIDATNIWATGTNSDYNGTVILSFDGTTWKKLYEGNYYGFSSVWTSTGRILFVAGDSGPLTLESNTLIFKKLLTPASYVMYSVRATGANDIFFTGQNSEVTHYNGSTYYLYADVQSMLNADTWWYSVKASKDFVVVGGGYDTGYNFAPVVARGYR